MNVTGIQQFERSVDVHTDRCLAVAQRVFETWIPRLTADMKQNHVWINRTGEAERKLRAFWRRNGLVISLVLESGAPHGVFLERRWQGRFAILLPTLRRNWPYIMRNIEDEWARVRVT